ncbi:MAG: hypothetical protein ABH883_09450 [Candidatus Omnitrophota bacterium]
MAIYTKFLTDPLNILKKTHPVQYKALTEHIDEYWFTDEIYSCAGISASDDKVYFFIEFDFRNKLSRFSNTVRTDILYLQTVHEATEFLAGDKKDTITPDITSEAVALVEETRAYLSLSPKRRKNVLDAAMKMDVDEPDQEDRFAPVIKFMDSLEGKDFYSEETMDNIEEFLKTYPVYVDSQGIDRVLFDEKITELQNKLFEMLIDREKNYLLQKEKVTELLRKFLESIDEFGQGEKLVIGIDTEWLPPEQKTMIKILIRTLRNICKSKGFENIVIIDGEGEQLSQKLSEEYDSASGNIIVLSGEKNIEQGKFDCFKATDEKHGAFLVGINLENFLRPEYLRKKSIDKGEIDNMKFLDLVKLSLILFQNERKQSAFMPKYGDIVVQTGGKRYYILVPAAEPIDCVQFEQECILQVKILQML